MRFPRRPRQVDSADLFQWARELPNGWVIACALLLLPACRSEPAQPPSSSPRTRAERRSAPRAPSLVRRATSAPSVRRPTPDPGARGVSRDCSCRDPRLEKAFEALSACNFRRGILDYQCPEWKALHQILSEQEQENRARVQLTLLALLRHKDERVRLSAARSLSGYARQRSVERSLVARFSIEHSAPVRAWILFALQGHTPASRRLLERALRKDHDAMVRSRAAQRAGGALFAADRAVRASLLAALAKDPSIEVRRRAAESLGQARGAPEVEKALLACLPDKQLGPHCALGLSRLGSVAGYRAVLARLRAGLSQHALPPLFLLSLGKFALLPAFEGPAVLTLLQRFARDPRMMTAVRQYAVKAVGQIASSRRSVRARAVQLLTTLSRDKVLGAWARMSLELLRKSERRAAGGVLRNPRAP